MSSVTMAEAGPEGRMCSVNNDGGWAEPEGRMYSVNNDGGLNHKDVCPLLTMTM